MELEAIGGGAAGEVVGETLFEEWSMMAAGAKALTGEGAMIPSVGPVAEDGPGD